MNMDRSEDHPSGGAGTGLLFVCLGNICRSPLAEGVMRHLVRERGLEGRFRVDSAGTGAYHVGEPPDARARRVAQENGVHLEGRARQVETDDFRRFHRVLAMDQANLRTLQSLHADAGEGAEPELLRAYDPECDVGGEVPDPYYGGPDGFDRVFRMVYRSCDALLDHLTGAGGGPAAPGSR